LFAVQLPQPSPTKPGSGASAVSYMVVACDYSGGAKTNPLNKEDL